MKITASEDSSALLLQSQASTVPLQASTVPQPFCFSGLYSASQKIKKLKKTGPVRLENLQSPWRSSSALLVLVLISARSGVTF